MKKRSVIAITLILFIVILGIIHILNSKRNSNIYSDSLITVSPTIFVSLTSTPVPTPTPTLTPTSFPTSTPIPIKFPYTTKNFYITFYGWPDNSPSGRAIAYPQNRFPAAKHNQTGGVGTYNDPVTFASDPNHIPVGTIYYVPYLKKYIVMEDLCAGCVESWNTSVPHIDIWMESNENFSGELWHCQRHWTRKEVEVFISPTANLSVNSQALFDVNTGSCRDSF